MTSPRPRPHLAPTAGATSPGDLAPRPPLLRRGAKSRGDLTTNTNTTPTSPQGRSQTITAHCPTHGPQTFIHNPAGNLWFCPELLTFPNDQPVVGCWSVILDEHVTPDGADVTQLLRRSEATP